MSELWLASSVLGITGFLISLILFLANRFAQQRDFGNDLVDTINAELPQTQCAQCGYPGCRPYAQAISEGAAINLCPPGGSKTAEQLASLMGINFENTPIPKHVDEIAVIKEDTCIGCGLCLPACPVDAISGAPKFMHTVLKRHCTGCGLCLPPCPVDCITLSKSARSSA
ncbi:MAG: electron transport complex subunit RsxB [Gammaproteobacteria bacterium]|nr:electron transport complex subunit RsxB [Gammaproteobacteria bacterium]